MQCDTYGVMLSDGHTLMIISFPGNCCLLGINQNSYTILTCNFTLNRSNCHCSINLGLHHHYRPQTKLREGYVLQVAVILLTRGGGLTGGCLTQGGCLPGGCLPGGLLGGV